MPPGGDGAAGSDGHGAPRGGDQAEPGGAPDSPTGDGEPGADGRAARGGAPADPDGEPAGAEGARGEAPASHGPAEGDGEGGPGAEPPVSGRGGVGESPAGPDDEAAPDAPADPERVDREPAPDSGADGAAGTSEDTGAQAADDTAANADADGEGAADDTAGDGEGAADSTAEEAGAAADGDAGEAEGAADGTAGDGEAVTDGTAGDGEAVTDGTAGGGEAVAPALSEAQAELAAQKVERERIARRKAEREAPVDAGAKLSGKAADLLAAVRAVESGAKPSPGYFDEAPAAPRRAAAPAPPQPRPAPAPAAAVTAGDVDAVRAVLARGGAPEALAATAAEALGDGAAERLAEDPWLLLGVPGVRPTQADGFAQALLGAGAGPGDARRGGALVGWLLAQAALKGHTALEAPVLEKALAQYGVPTPAEALEAAIGDGAVLVFHEPLGEPVAEGEEQPVRILVGLEEYALAEESLADGLARLSATFTAPADWSAAATGPGAELVRAVAGHGLVVHTGGEAARAEPTALLAAARGLGLRACLAAHVPAAGAVTVAGLLSGTDGPGRDADGRFDLDLLVVLDAPQLDVETAAALVESVPDGARLVLSGDPGVLGSAGPGRVFADLLAARGCPQVVSRKPDPGPLGELVSGIGIGELNQVDAPGKEVVIVPVRDAGEAVHRTVQLVAESVPRAFGIPAEAVQVITPGHGGSAGTRALNAALKERLNPGPGRFGGFDPGDRVAYVPSPGRALPARVVSADAQGLHLEDAEGARILVPKDRVESRVRHGWAVTAHQAVGARWPAVVVVLPGDAAQALSRDWVYTAFGRAGRHLSVVHGVDQALAQAVAQVLPKPRTTRLTGLLRALTEAQEPQP
ncbi:ATP-binding domain-containing protein [Streptomyces sp. NBC_00249]|uniref:helix-hairpin-helix domain-containing protein n=1 Tax=Streptomyces sp. NBC_00249 TaxID=2975690 RepID=UPI002255AA2A|nr:helix-hairpin-helix domain-containing protein [Streptomyces sp. NBC_00249]MCX5197692.1 ATP-binding domain-containing protein [Streptomyces sp. NBC_00249]